MSTNIKNFSIIVLVFLLAGTAPCFFAAPAPAADNSTYDAVSSATPGLDEKILTESHTGWERADCLSCHAQNHEAGYTPPVCTTCHGGNGAPKRPVNHSTTNCLNCHSSSHTDLSFADSQDCLICHRYPGSGSASAQTQFDAVIIGAGGGGLSAAALLARAGLKVIVLEQHYKVGGYMANFQRGPYTFEISLHGFDGLDPDHGMNVALFKELGIEDKVSPVKLSPMYYAVYPDGFDLTVPADADEYLALLKQQFPVEADGIDSLYYTMDRVYSALLFMTNLQQGRFAEAAGMYQPWMFVAFAGSLNKTLSQLLSEHITDQKLAAVITQLSGFGGAEPDNISALFFIAMWASYHKGGFYYFEDGSQSVATAMAEVIEGNGGQIRLATRAEKIEIKNGRAVSVQSQDGEVFACRYVVSNANAPDTFNKMIGREHLPAKYLADLDGMAIGLSMIQIFLGVDYDYSSSFPGRVHEFIVNVSYDQSEAFGYISAGDPENAPYAILNYTLAAPELAPPGSNVLCISSILPYDWRDNWHTDNFTAYNRLKQEVADIYIRRAEQYLPDLSSHIKVMEIGTPHTMEGFTLNPGGTIFGWDNVIDQSLFKRLPQKTPIKNLFLAGAWTFPGGGQSAVMSSGQQAANSILKLEKRKWR